MSLEDWAYLGDAVGGLATGIGLLFVIYGVVTWKSQKLLERRADMAAVLARQVIDLSGATARILVQCRARLQADPLLGTFMALDGWVQGRAGSMSRLQSVLKKELQIATFYFSRAELKSCRALARVCDGAIQTTQRVLGEAIGTGGFTGTRIPGTPAIIEQLVTLYARVTLSRFTAKASLRRAAGYEETAQRAWRLLRRVAGQSANRAKKN